MGIITSKHRHVKFSAASQNVTENSHSQSCGRMHNGDGHCSRRRRSPAAMPQSAAWLHKQTDSNSSFFSIFYLWAGECPIRPFITITGRARHHSTLIYQSCSPANGKRLYSGGIAFSSYPQSGLFALYGQALSVSYRTIRLAF